MFVVYHLSSKTQAQNKGRVVANKIGIIGAMDIEVQTLEDKMQNKVQHTVAGMSFCEGTLNGVNAVVSMCKVGKVNAAACTQILVDRFGITHVINTGAAGSLDAKINIGDIVVSVDAVNHDMDVRYCGYELGQVPGLDVMAFPASAKLRKIALEAVAQAAPDVNAYEGTVASGDQFVADQAIKNRVKQQFGALCCEMEGAAIAQTAYLNGIPFVIMRAISDKADGSDSENYDEFEAKAARHCAMIVQHMVANMR